MLLKFKLSEGLVGHVIFEEESESIVAMQSSFLFPVWMDQMYMYPGEGIISLN